MSATLGTLLKDLQPDLKIAVLERLSDVAQESSNAWNNRRHGPRRPVRAELQPEGKDGSIDPAKAVTIYEQFQQSRQLWASLVAEGWCSTNPRRSSTRPRMTFVRGEKDVAFLRKRYEVLKAAAAVRGHRVQRGLPRHQPVGAPSHAEASQRRALRGDARPAGTDVDFGSLTRQLFAILREKGVEVVTNHDVKKLRSRRTARGRCSTAM